MQTNSMLELARETRKKIRGVFRKEWIRLLVMISLMNQIIKCLN